MLGWLNPYVIVAVLLGLAGAFGGGYWRGYRAADRSAQIELQATVIASLEKALAEQRRQASAAQLVAEAARAREEALQQLQDDMQAEIDDYVRRLEQARAPVECALDRSDVERLRHLATGGRASTHPTRPARPAAEPGASGPAGGAGGR